MDVEDYLVQDALVFAIGRAVHKRAPARFVHQAMEPMKQGGTFHYGLRIHPLHDTPTVRSAKDAPRSSYEIWRTWEDCLYLQDLLEDEYTKLVKGQRSHRIKKAFPSPRAEPDVSLANHMPDVHSYLPRLNKKGTLFKPSAATIAQRCSEYHALVNALLRDDLPPALSDLRDDRVVHDFFGYWRQDYDLAKKTGVPVPADEPANRKDSTMSNLDARKPMFRVQSGESSWTGPPSLTSGSSSDVPCCSSLPTPSTERWSEAIRNATYPPGYLPGLIQQTQALDSGPPHGTHHQKAHDLTVHLQTNHEVFPNQDDGSPVELVYAALPSIANTRDDMHDIPASTVGAPVSAQSPNTWAPLRPRTRSASIPQPRDDALKPVPSIQPAPPPGTIGAKIIVFPSSGSPEFPSLATSPGLPIPPPMPRQRAMTAISQDRLSSSYTKTHSGGTFGGFNDNEVVASSRGSVAVLSAEDRPMSSTSLGVSVLSGSQVTSDISCAQIAHVMVGKASKTPPQIVWLQRQPAAGAPFDSGVSSPVEPILEEFYDSSSSEEDEPAIIPQVLDIRKSQLDAYLDMDVSQRWWRTKPDIEESIHDDVEIGIKTGIEKSHPIFVPSTDCQPTPMFLTTAAPLSTSSSSMSSLSRQASLKSGYDREAVALPPTKVHPTPIILTTAQPPSNISTVSLGRQATSRTESGLNGHPVIMRSSSITAYAYSIERLRRSDPRHIKHWAAHVPVGIQEEEPVQ